MEMLALARPLSGRTPLIVGGGTNPDNIAKVLPHANGVVVGAYLKRDGVENAAVDASRAERYVRAVHAARRDAP
jgi:predicted TIM-barrel enzyme